MCSIFGIIRLGDNYPMNFRTDFNHLMTCSTIRGRDGWGFARIPNEGSPTFYRSNKRWADYNPDPWFRFLIGNCRAEPTTEWVENKQPEDQQPYALDDWIIVHNGTVANDSELRDHTLRTEIDSAAIVEYLNKTMATNLHDLLNVTVGSYAILAVHLPTMRLHVACNYRPIWVSRTNDRIYFGSNREFIPREGIGAAPEMMQPYSYSIFDVDGNMIQTMDLLPFTLEKRALVICSSGLDSTVAAQACKNRGDDVTLLHFRYGSRAEGRELTAIRMIAEEMKVPLVVKALPIYDAEDSNLLNPVCDIAGGEKGAEFAHEWVPARNLVMLAIATAYAEAKGFDIIVLGNNLEEAGAYPDNEPEFIDKFNDLLPFAVGDKKRVRVEMPVGNMMKHEIVEYGLRIKAPLHLTWSCYKNGSLHCGVCGPCYMRRKAFEINQVEEVIEYASEH